MAMHAEDETFDVVIDKGTLDSILCGLEGSHDAKKALNEVERWVELESPA